MEKAVTSRAGFFDVNVELLRDLFNLPLGVEIVNAEFPFGGFGSIRFHVVGFDVPEPGGRMVCVQKVTQGYLEPVEDEG